VGAQMLFELLKQRERVSRSSGKAGDHPAAVQPAHFFRPVFDDRPLAKGDLTVTADGSLAVVVNGDDRRRVKEVFGHDPRSSLNSVSARRSRRHRGDAFEAAALAVGGGEPLLSRLWRRLAITALLIEAHMLGAFALPLHAGQQPAAARAALGDGPLPAGKRAIRIPAATVKHPAPARAAFDQGLAALGTRDPDLHQ